MRSHFVVARQLVLEHAKPDETVCGFLLATIAFRIVTPVTLQPFRQQQNVNYGAPASILYSFMCEPRNVPSARLCCVD